MQTDLNLCRWLATKSGFCMPMVNMQVSFIQLIQKDGNTHKEKKYSNPYRENLIVKNSGLLCSSSSRCHGFVCSLRLWYFRIILTIFVLTKNIFSDSYKFMKYHVNSSSHCHDVNHFIPWLTEVFRKAVTIAISQKVTENDQETPQSHTKDT